jgi:circadian clock protein KaiC
LRNLKSRSANEKCVKLHSQNKWSLCIQTCGAKFLAKLTVKIPRAGSGIPGFDHLVSDGIPRGNMVILAGHAGVGKTTFCMQFLAHGALLGERGVYISFSEIKPKLYQSMAQFGFNLDSLEEKELLRSEFLKLDSQNTPLIAIDAIVRAIEEFSPKRLVIDSASSLALAVNGNRSDTTSMLQSLFSRIGAFVDLTTILTAEMSSGTDQFGSGIEEFISDGIVLLRFRNRGKAKIRAIEVKKMRGTFHSTKSVLCDIGENGIEVDPEIELTS